MYNISCLFFIYIYGFGDSGGGDLSEVWWNVDAIDD